MLLLQRKKVKVFDIVVIRSPRYRKTLTKSLAVIIVT